MGSLLTEYGDIGILILLTMLFLHIVDDYYLQGVLAKLKQRSWWEEHNPDPLYRHDYIVALVEHAFSWTFMITFPIMVIIFTNKYTELINPFVVIFVLNIMIHAWMDHLKANIQNASLLVDQIVHAAQVFGTWATMMSLIK